MNFLVVHGYHHPATAPKIVSRHHQAATSSASRIHGLMGAGLGSPPIRPAVRWVPCRTAVPGQRGSMGLRINYARGCNLPPASCTCWRSAVKTQSRHFPVAASAMATIRRGQPHPPVGSVAEGTGGGAGRGEPGQGGGGDWESECGEGCNRKQSRHRLWRHRFAQAQPHSRIPAQGIDRPGRADRDEPGGGGGRRRWGLGMALDVATKTTPIRVLFLRTTPKPSPVSANSKSPAGGSGSRSGKSLSGGGRRRFR